MPKQTSAAVDDDQQAMAREREWRIGLTSGEVETLRKWVAAAGPQRVASVVAVLADGGGRRGQPEKLEVDLLLQIAAQLKQTPQASLHSIVVIIATAAHPNRKPRIALESLISKLERDFRNRWLCWTAMERQASGLDANAAARRDDRPPRAVEARILARLIDLQYQAIDLFELMKADTRHANIEQFQLLKGLGRNNVEPLIERAMRVLLDPATGPQFPRQRSLGLQLFALIEPELRRLDDERRRGKATPRGIGRKSGKQIQ